MLVNVGKAPCAWIPHTYTSNNWIIPGSTLTVHANSGPVRAQPIINVYQSGKQPAGEAGNESSMNSKVDYRFIRL